MVKPGVRGDVSDGRLRIAGSRAEIDGDLVVRTEVRYGGEDLYIPSESERGSVGTAVKPSVYTEYGRWGGTYSLGPERSRL